MPSTTFSITVAGGTERELLGDRRDPVVEGFARAAADRAAVDDQLPVVGPDHAADDLAERRLPGAVLADEPVHGASGNLDADVIERLGAGVPLPDRDEPDGAIAVALIRPVLDL